MIELDILAAESLGRDTVAQAELGEYRELFTLSRSRLSRILGTSTKIVNGWEADPGMAKRMHSMSAARLGQLINQMDNVLADLRDLDIHPGDYMPISNVATRMGVSPNSARVTGLCATGVLDCADFGILGVYVPRRQVEKALSQ